jgi:Protein of unknown function (DUF3108)
LRGCRLGSSRAAVSLASAWRWLLVGFLAYVLATGPATADFDEPVELRYRFTWAGLPFAELGLRHATNTTVYQTEIAIRTIGLADQVVGFRASSHATGLYEEPDGFSASRYRSASSTYRKSRRILVRFDRETGDVIELDLTRSGQPDRSKVPAALQKGVMDPLTAVLQMRHQLATAGDLDGYRAAVFDGRRRFDAEAKVMGRHRAQPNLAGGRARDQPHLARRRQLGRHRQSGSGGQSPPSEAAPERRRAPYPAAAQHHGLADHGHG